MAGRRNVCSCCTAVVCISVLVSAGVILICLGAASVPLFDSIYVEELKKVRLHFVDFLIFYLYVLYRVSLTHKDHSQDARGWPSGQGAGFPIQGSRVQNHWVAPRSTQPFILPRSVK